MLFKNKLLKIHVVLLFVLALNFSYGQGSNSVVIVIHGGAGTIKKDTSNPAKEQAYREKLSEAVEKGYEILKNGGNGLDAVQEVVEMLEDSPLFNAGKGAVLTNTGKVELDASIMDGKTMKSGAVAGVTTIKNPIEAARKVMINSPYVFLIGKGAEDFAAKEGLEIVDNSYFITEERKKLFEKNKKEQQRKAQGSLVAPVIAEKYGTVGAVALDKYGNIAAATSTGGVSGKMYGRVGDSPMIGAGTYANNRTCGVSATGQGEYFIRSVVAYDISALMDYKGYSLEKAAREVVFKLTQMGGYGGVISIDKEGNIATIFNTDGMYRAGIDREGKKFVHIFKEE